MVEIQRSHIIISPPVYNALAKYCQENKIYEKDISYHLGDTGDLLIKLGDNDPYELHYSDWTPLYSS